MNKKAKMWTLVAVVAAAAILLIVKMTGGGVSVGTPGPITDKDWTWGNKSSKIVLIEYSDFQCPGCRQAWALMKEVKQEFGDKIVYAYRYFPLKKLHPNGESAAWAAEAAGKQGKFWEMHDILFGYQDDWEKEADPWVKYEKYGANLNLDMQKFRQDYDSGAVKSRVADSLKESETLGLGGTPTFFLNGKWLDLKKADLKSSIRDAVNAAPTK